MEITIGQYTGYLIPTMYASNDRKAIMFSEEESGSGMIGMVTVNLVDTPLLSHQIVLEQDKFGEGIGIYTALREAGLILEGSIETRSGFNIYKVVGLTEKGMSLFPHK